MPQTGYSRRAVLGASVGITASIAGCLGQDSGSDPESQENGDEPSSETSCGGIDGEMTSILPDTAEYSIGTTETFTDNAPFGLRSAIAIYPDVEGSKYEFLIIEFSDAESASDTKDEVLTGNDFDQIGYVMIEEYFVGVGGAEQDLIRSIMEASSLDSACVGAIQFA